MKSLFVFIAAVVSFAYLTPVEQVGAIENTASWQNQFGGKVISDTLIWSNGVSGTRRNTKIDTLVGTADKDTSRGIIPIAGASSVSLQHWIKNIQGTAGDGSANGNDWSNVSVIPQFSNDGVTWTDVLSDTLRVGQANTGVHFSTPASPHKTTASAKWHIIKPLPLTTLIADSVYNKARSIPNTARFMRVRALNREGSATDTTFLVTILTVVYPSTDK